MDCASYSLEQGLFRESSSTDGSDDFVKPEQEKIRQEVTKAELDPKVGVHLKSWDWLSDNPYALLSVAGPEETPFEGGLFEVEIRCSPKWPSLWFKTKVWHPNVCSITGEVCPVIEADFGGPVLMHIGQYMQWFLADPQLENAKNPSAARQCRDNLDEFNRTAREWTARYAKLDMCPADHQALLDLFPGNRDPTAGVTSLSGWYAIALHDDGRLACLNLNNHDLKGELKPSVGKFVALTHLYLAGNSLTGCIPEHLGDLHALRVLNLSQNRLTGAIPREICNIQVLQVLDLSENRLEGTIPRELCNARSLQILGLSRNQLEGHIPEHLGALHVLRVLNLSQNRLTGAIPRELCNARSLQILVLSMNQLEGRISENLGNLRALRHLYLSENRLTVKALCYKMVPTRPSSV